MYLPMESLDSLLQRGQSFPGFASWFELMLIETGAEAFIGGVRRTVQIWGRSLRFENILITELTPTIV
jgi:hypothetical protein